MRRRLTTAPLRVCTEPVRLRNPAARRIPRSYVFCTRSGFAETAARARADGLDYHELDTKHMAMLTAPDELVELLHGIAGPAE